MVSPAERVMYAMNRYTLLSVAIFNPYFPVSPPFCYPPYCQPPCLIVGYILSVGFLVSQLVQTALFQQLWYLSVVSGMRVRAALISIIYKKVRVTLTPSARGRVAFTSSVQGSESHSLRPSGFTLCTHSVCPKSGSHSLHLPRVRVTLTPICPESGSHSLYLP